MDTAVPLSYMITGTVFLVLFCFIAGYADEMFYIIIGIVFFFFWPLALIIGVCVLIGRLLATRNFPIIYRNFMTLLRNIKSKRTGDEPEEYEELNHF